MCWLGWFSSGLWALWADAVLRSILMEARYRASSVPSTRRMGLFSVVMVSAVRRATSVKSEVVMNMPVAASRRSRLPEKSLISSSSMGSMLSLARKWILSRPTVVQVYDAFGDFVSVVFEIVGAYVSDLLKEVVDDIVEVVGVEIWEGVADVVGELGELRSEWRGVRSERVFLGVEWVE